MEIEKERLEYHERERKKQLRSLGMSFTPQLNAVSCDACRDPTPGEREAARYLAHLQKKRKMTKKVAKH